MRKIAFAVLSLFFTLQVNAQFNLGSILGKVTNDSTATSVVGNILGNVLADDDVELSQLVGTWDYSSPAVSFKSENVLKSLGGSAASATIENKLKDYYKKAGLTNLSLTIDSDANFSMKTKYATLKGTIEKGENGVFVFNFSAFGTIKIGKLNAYTTLSGSTLSLTFDMKKLIDLAKKIAEISKNSTAKSAMSLLESYDGVTAGFKLKKK